MRKVLIWDKNAKLSNRGGPTGYMWNIKHYIDTNPIEEIMFYSDILSGENSVKYILRRFHPIRILLYILYKCKLPFAKQILTTYFPIGSLTINEKEEIKKFDYVHFHSISMMRAYGRQVQELGVKTILTSHAPEVLIDEIFSETYKGAKFLNRHKRIRKIFIMYERKCMDESNYLMYPVPQISECFDDSQAHIIKEYILSNPHKIFYVPTGIVDSYKQNVAFNYLSNLNIPDNAIKICYVGRHNEVKGYPYLKKIAAEILKSRRDIYFIIGGQQSEEHPLHDRNWIELGWVDTQQLLKEVDIFILPNQNTYFDIIALEILRSGVPLITTYTGGNKYLAIVNTGGIQFIPNNDVKEAVKNILGISKDDLKKKGELNRILYEKEFSMSVYLDKYVKSIRQLS